MYSAMVQEHATLKGYASAKKALREQTANCNAQHPMVWYVAVMVDAKPVNYKCFCNTNWSMSKIQDHNLLAYVILKTRTQKKRARSTLPRAVKVVWTRLLNPRFLGKHVTFIANDHLGLVPKNATA